MQGKNLGLFYLLDGGVARAQKTADMQTFARYCQAAVLNGLALEMHIPPRDHSIYGLKLKLQDGRFWEHETQCV
jgi:hypothetical protein